MNLRAHSLPLVVALLASGLSIGPTLELIPEPYGGGNDNFVIPQVAGRAGGGAAGRASGRTSQVTPGQP